MIVSEPRRITFRGHPARLYVLRNSGYAWGRIVQGRDQFDVTTRVDVYERCDDDALDTLARASKRPGAVAPAAGLLI